MREDQKLLMRYLIDLKAPWDCTLFIVGCLDTDELIMEMFQYIVEHPDAEYQELYEVTCKIAEREGILEDE